MNSTNGARIIYASVGEEGDQRDGKIVFSNVSSKLKKRFGHKILGGLCHGFRNPESKMITAIATVLYFFICRYHRSTLVGSRHFVINLPE